MCFSTLLLLFVKHLLLLLLVSNTVNSSLSTNLQFASFKTCLKKHGINIVYRHQNAKAFSYNYLNYQWNLYYKQKYPLAYILPTSSQDVASAVSCGYKNQIHLIPKSGGHSYIKASFGDKSTVVVDVRRLTSWNINRKQKYIDIGAGFLSGQLSGKIVPLGYFIPNGLCPTVGISYSLGGGFSFLSRTYGLVVDSILELGVIDTHGKIQAVNKYKHKDLFWALRGAGTSGSFGIVTRYRFKLNKIPKRIIYGKIIYNLNEFPEVFDSFQKYINSGPRNSINVIMTVVGKNQTIILEMVQVIKKRQPSYVKKILNSKFPHSTDIQLKIFKFVDYLQIGAYGEPSGNYSNVTRHDYGPIYFKGTSFYVRSLIAPHRISVLDKMIQKIPKYLTVEFQAHGGKINQFGPKATAYYHRRQNIYKVNPDYLAPFNRTKKEETKSITWQRNLFQLTKTLFDHTESYQNNQDSDLADYLERYYGKKFERLMEIKKKFDPTNYFTNVQSINPS